MEWPPQGPREGRLQGHAWTHARWGTHLYYKPFSPISIPEFNWGTCLPAPFSRSLGILGVRGHAKRSKQKGTPNINQNAYRIVGFVMQMGIQFGLSPGLSRGGAHKGPKPGHSVPDSGRQPEGLPKGTPIMAPKFC